METGSGFERVHEARDAATDRAQADPEMSLKRSTDGGVTYQQIATPARPSPVCDKHMYSPALHYDDAGNLFMEFICYEHLSKATTGTREVWLTASLDDGDTWLPSVRLVQEQHAPCQVPFVTPGVNQLNPCWRWYDGADYWFMTGAGGSLHAYWVDDTSGTSSVRTQTFTIG